MRGRMLLAKWGLVLGSGVAVAQYPRSPELPPLFPTTPTGPQAPQFPQTNPPATLPGFPQSPGSAMPGLPQPSRLPDPLPPLHPTTSVRPGYSTDFPPVGQPNGKPVALPPLGSPNQYGGPQPPKNQP